MTRHPKVSVLVLAYNHERFVERAVRSALEQTAAFDCEIVVGEDCSTDGTRRVLARLAAEHPGTLRVLWSDRNLGMMRNFIATYAACRGDYVAMLEGDDYWTHPEKLQRQADALGEREDRALCFHRAAFVDEDDRPLGRVHPAGQVPRVDLARLLRTNPIQTCSVMVRRAMIPEIPEFFSRLGLGDWPLFMLAARVGEVHFIDEVMAAYRVHGGGLWSQATTAHRRLATLDMLIRMAAAYPDILDTMDRMMAAGEPTQLTEIVQEMDALHDALAATRRRLAVAEQSTWRRPGALLRWLVERLGPLRGGA